MYITAEQPKQNHFHKLHNLMNYNLKVQLVTCITTGHICTTLTKLPKQNSTTLKEKKKVNSNQEYEGLAACFPRVSFSPLGCSPLTWPIWIDLSSWLSVVLWKEGKNARFLSDESLSEILQMGQVKFCFSQMSMQVAWNEWPQYGKVRNTSFSRYSARQIVHLNHKYKEKKWRIDEWS
jgi:hypothetical protein